MIRCRSRATLSATLLSFALLSAACSGPGTSTTPPTTAAPTTTAPAAPTVDPGSLVVEPAVPTTARATDASLATPDGRTRTFHAFVPTALDGGPAPLLIALHGGGGWGQQYEKNSGFDGLAEANGFIVVYPDGVGVGDAGTDLRTWNGGRCCGPSVKQDVDDVTFIRLLIDRMEADHQIDPDRVFAAGHSNGGMLAYRLACELSDRIAAIGVQSSALEVDDCQPSKPVSVLHVHGTADQNVPIDGGVGPKARAGVDFTRPLSGLTSLAAAGGCPPRSTVSQDPDNADLTITEWTPCGGETTVSFVAVAGASHAWMGHAAGGSALVGPAYEGFDSSLQIWNFLAQHPRS